MSNKKISLSIFDVQGRVLYRSNSTVIHGKSSFKLPNNFSKGIRILSITGEGIKIQRHLFME
jgi:hypothetical protein